MSQNQIMAYLTSPYTHEEKNIRDTRYLVTARMAAQLIRDGIHAEGEATMSKFMGSESGKHHD